MKHKILLGAIAGDVIGSVYEFNPVWQKDFELITRYSGFTDDTVMTVANADWLVSGDSLLGIMQEYGNKYRGAGYGGMFYNWLVSRDPQPYNSFGNGSAMRVSPVGWAFNTLEETLAAAKQSAEVTHSHPEGIKGAQATAACIFLARTGSTKEEIKSYVEETFGYNLSRTCDEIRPSYKFDETCQGSVPESIIAFLESTDFEDAIRLAVSLGGDADTMGAITGAIAEAYYKETPAYIVTEVLKKLPEEFKEVMERFYEKFVIAYGMEKIVMKRQSSMNLSIISVALLVFVLPLVTLCHPEDVWCFTSRMYYGIQVCVMHLALAIWFFRLGASIGKSKGVKIDRGVKIALILLCIAVYICKNFLMYPMDNWDIYNYMSWHIGGYLSEMLTYRLPIILYGPIFFVIGILVSVGDVKLSGCRLKQFGWVLPLLFLIGCCASEWLYFRNRFYAMIVSALAIFPLIGTVLVVYRFTVGKAFDNYVEKHIKFLGFVTYLYPSAIFIYVFKIYSIPIFVLFYICIMWLIYRYVGKIKT